VFRFIATREVGLDDSHSLIAADGAGMSTYAYGSTV
jgi:hypothetical protein